MIYVRCLKNCLSYFLLMSQICFYLEKNPDDLIRIMNEEMVKVVDWLQLNRLSLNLDKTHFILFRRKRVKTSLSEDLIINNIEIGVTERTKFLGVIIDQNLSFQSHILYIKGKVTPGIGILYKSRPYFGLETMRMLYNAFVYPYFTYMYCIEVWGNAYQSYLEPLVKLQKLLMYKYHHDHLPPIFSDFYVQNNLVHDYHTRQENLFHVPLIRTAPLSKSVRVSGVSLYNHFKNLIFLRVSYVTYKYNLKRYILDNTTLNLVKTSWLKFPWYIMCYFNDFQYVTLEASLCKDHWFGAGFGISTGERVEMAQSRSLPSIFVLNLRNFAWAHYGCICLTALLWWWKVCITNYMP